MGIERFRGYYTPYCDGDGCEAELDSCLSFESAREEMWQARWSRRLTEYGWENLCPACQARERTAKQPAVPAENRRYKS